MTGRRPDVAVRDDRGATLLELLVGLTVMMVFLSIFSGSMMLISKAQTKTSAISESADQVNQAFLWLDKNVRYAAVITTPGLGTSTRDWYVELRNTTSGNEVCTQLRLDIAKGQLQRRSWSVSGSTATTPTVWQPVASGLSNTTAPPDSADQPFYSAATATGSERFQRLRVTLVATSGPKGRETTARSSFTFTAINSTLPRSSAAVCQEAGRP